MKKIEIVIPSYNEEDNIPVMRDRLEQVFSEMPGMDYSIIFVNDGSSDYTQKVLVELAQSDPKIKYIELSKNFGHQAALKAGLNNTDKNSDAVISMDGDLQHPPELIPELIRKWQDGSDVVYTIRKYDSGESIFKKLSSKIYYKIFEIFSDLDFERGEGADFKLYDAKVIAEIKYNKESDLFLRGLVKWIGFKQTGVYFKTEERKSGESKYTFHKMIQLALTGITSFSVKPLYIAAYLGFFFSVLSLLYIPYVIRSFIVGTEISGWASLLMTVVFFGGLQLSILGIIGIYLGKIFLQVKERPLYIIRSKNF